MNPVSRAWHKLRNRRKTIYINPLKRGNLLIESFTVFWKSDKDLVDALQHAKALGSYPDKTDKPVIFFACDEGYFDRFAEDLIQSVLFESPSCHIHLHLYCPGHAALSHISDLSSKAGEALTYTYDTLPPPYAEGEMRRFYYASARCIYLSFLADQVSVPVLSIDVDAVVRKDILQFIQQAQGADVGLFERPRKRRVWRRVAAGAILINPTSKGRRFAREIAVTTMRFIRRSPDFHIDQLTIYYALRMRRLLNRPFRVWQIPKTLLDWDFSPDSAIWSAKGSERKEILVEKLNDER